MSAVESHLYCFVCAGFTGFNSPVSPAGECYAQAPAEQFSPQLTQQREVRTCHCIDGDGDGDGAAPRRVQRVTDLVGLPSGYMECLGFTFAICHSLLSLLIHTATKRYPYNYGFEVRKIHIAKMNPKHSM